MIVLFLPFSCSFISFEDWVLLLVNESGQFQSCRKTLTMVTKLMKREWQSFSNSHRYYNKVSLHSMFYDFLYPRVNILNRITRQYFISQTNEKIVTNNCWTWEPEWSIVIRRYRRFSIEFILNFHSIINSRFQNDHQTEMKIFQISNYDASRKKKSTHQKIQLRFLTDID